MFTEWKLTDNDCCQYIRKDGRKFELIQYVWFDVSKDDIQAGLYPYGVMTAEVNLDDLTESEIIETIKSYGYTLVELIETYGYAANEIIAECYMEDISREGLSTQFESEEEAIKFIRDYCDK